MPLRKTVVVAHRMASVAHADHVVVLDHGRAVDQGPPDILHGARGVFARFVKAERPPGTGVMSFRIVDVELTVQETAVTPIDLRPHETGLALIVRDGGRIIGFEMHNRAELPAYGPIHAAELVTWETREAALAERLRRRLAPADDGVLRFSVAICTKDRPDRLARLLGSLARLAAPGPFEIIVVDNAPADARPREVVRSAAAARYVVEPRAGLDFALNAAIGAASGDVLAYLDDDVTVDCGWLGGLRQAWSRHHIRGAWAYRRPPREGASSMRTSDSSLAAAWLRLRIDVSASRPEPQWIMTGSVGRRDTLPVCYSHAGRQDHPSRCGEEPDGKPPAAR